jgi:hypothetical protein
MRSDNAIAPHHVHQDVDLDLLDLVCSAHDLTMRGASLQGRATMDTSQTIAASQQLAAYAVLIAAEGLWGRSRMDPQPGRPGIVPTVAGIVSMLGVRTVLPVRYHLAGDVLQFA